MKERESIPTESPTAVFEPDTLMPVQYAGRHGSRRAHIGEYRLMMAILEDAIDVYRKHAGAAKGRKRNLFDDAEAWVESHDNTWIFSFENICDVLDFDVDCLRSGLRRHKQLARGCTRAEVIPLRLDTIEPPVRRTGSGPH